MASVNRVILLGNMTRDPMTKQLPSQTTVAEFGLAMNRKWKTEGGEEREEVCFVDCAAFGRQAEVIAQFCQKGKRIFVEGRLKLDTWEDKNGGGKRSKLSVVVENFQFLDSPRQDGEGADNPAHSAPIRPGRRDGRDDGRIVNQQRPQAPFGDERQFKEADIPF